MAQGSVSPPRSLGWFWLGLVALLMMSMVPDLVVSFFRGDKSPPAAVVAPTQEIASVQGEATPKAKSVVSKTPFLDEIDAVITRRFQTPRFRVVHNVRREQVASELEYVDFSEDKSTKFQLPAWIGSRDKWRALFGDEVGRTQDQLRDAYYRSLSVVEEELPNVSFLKSKSRLTSLLDSQSREFGYFSPAVKGGYGDGFGGGSIVDNLSFDGVGDWIEPYANSDRLLAEVDRSVGAVRGAVGLGR